MIKAFFISQKPSHFKVNFLIQTFIVSEMFLWSAWNFVMPIFALFAVNNIKDGSIEVAASSVSVYMIGRVLAELLSGRILVEKSEKYRMVINVIGMLITGITYLGFAYSTRIFHLFLFYAIAGIGLGIASPAKYSLFSAHLDKGKETTEWSFYDATVFIGMALSAALGGFIAKNLGFRFLFLLAAGVNYLGVLPYIFYLLTNKPKSSGDFV